MKKVILLAVLVVLAMVPAAYAKDFGSAFSAAVSNIPQGADVGGMGNAWVATPEFSSLNPAIIAILPKPEEFHATLMPTYGIIGFSKGPDIQLYSVSVTGKLPYNLGVLQVAYSDGWSNFAQTADPATSLKINSSPTIDVQYGLKVGKNLIFKGDELYAGVGYAHGESKISMRSEFFDPEFEETFTVNAFEKGYSDSVSVGMVYRPTKNINIGAFYSHSWDKNTSSVAGFANETSRSETDSLRLGVGLQITETTFIAADYQHLSIDGVRFDQWFAGVEQGIIKDLLYIYAGWAADGPTAGVGIYFKHGGLNISYSANQSRDLKPHLGKSEVIMLSAYLTF